jgi:hypothetical protein
MPKLKGELILLVLLLLAPAIAQKKSPDQLRTEAEHASGGHRGALYAELAERLVYIADEQFTAGDSNKGQQTVREILEDATRARDAGVSSRKKLKEIEIHLRVTQRHLSDVRRTLAAEDRPALEAVEKKLADYREDLLNAMFGPKKERK